MAADEPNWIETEDGLLFDPDDPYNEIVDWSPATLEEAEIRRRERQAQILGHLMMSAAESAAARQPVYEPEIDVQPASPQDWLFVEDIRGIFNCGESKARKIMAELPCVRIGKRNAIKRVDLDAYIEKNGGVTVKWERKR